MKKKPISKGGPRTPEGKSASSQNSRKHGAYSEEIKELRRLLKEQRSMLDGLIDV